MKKQKYEIHNQEKHQPIEIATEMTEIMKLVD